MNALSLTEDYAAQPRLGRFWMTASPRFADWLDELEISLAVSTYQSGHVILIGRNPATGGISIFTRLFQRPMGMAFDGFRLAVATVREIRTFVAEANEDYDAVFVSDGALTTEFVDTHDIAFGRDGKLVFVNTGYSCLAETTAGNRFHVVWRPPFISKHYAPEDRCHLNGMAMRDGFPAYVTAIAETDTHSGWRDKQASGCGILVDVYANEIICRGFWMPHSPRLHEGKLWILNSGAGEIGIVDIKAGRFDPITFCPGYLRGLAFVGHYALIGLSKPRSTAIPSGAINPLQKTLNDLSVDQRCAVYVLDTRSGNLVHWFRFEDVVNELYDIVVLPKIMRPMMTGRFVGKGELHG